MAGQDQLRELEERPVGRLLAAYSLPAIIGMAAMSAYNIIDSIYVGLWCNAYAIAAMALVFPIMNLTVAVGTLVGLGSAATASIMLGQQKRTMALRVLGHCIVLGLLFGFTVGWLPLPWLRPILVLFGAKGPTLQPAYDFMLIMALGFPISSGFMNLNHLMRASGYPKKAMVSLLISVATNTALAPVFIHLLGWGIRGAATATIISQAIGLVWVLSHYMRRSSVLHFTHGIYRLRFPLVKRICTIGLPPCLLNIVGCVVVVVFNQLFLQYDGPMGVGAFGVVNRTMFFFVMLVLGIAQGMQPIAGYNLGMGNYARVKRVLYYAMGAGVCITTAGCLLVQLFPSEIASLFAQNEQDGNASVLRELVAHGIHLISLCFPIAGAQIIIGNFFQAIGRPVMSIFLNLTRQLIFLLPSLWILPRCLGENGIWLSASLADALSSTFCLVVLYLFLTRIFTKTPAAHVTR